MQPEPSLPQEPQVETPLPETKKPRKKINFLAVFLVIVLLALAGVGYWAFTLNTNLKATQDALATLQGKYDSLTAEKNTLSSDLGQTTTELETTKAELEKTKEELSTAQADLTKSQDQNKELQAKISSAGKKAEILFAFSSVKTATDFLAVDSLIKATKDEQLIKQWANFTTLPTAESSTNFLLYLITALRDDLK